MIPLYLSATVELPYRSAHGCSLRVILAHTSRTLHNGANSFDMIAIPSLSQDLSAANPSTHVEILFDSWLLDEVDLKLSPLPVCLMLENVSCGQCSTCILTSDAEH